MFIWLVGLGIGWRGRGMHKTVVFFFLFALVKVVCFGSNGTLNICGRENIMCQGVRCGLWWAIVRFGSGSIRGECVRYFLSGSGWDVDGVCLNRFRNISQVHRGYR